MVAKVFIDGEAGTTGLQIRARLEGRSDIELLHLGDDVRKDAGARADALNAADISILCLPDAAARDAVAMLKNPDARVIDASSAHRVSDGWVYGFAEMDAGQAEKIKHAKRVSNPGCYAVSSVSMLHPLVSRGLIPADHPITINAISGYSGGGRQMIESFEQADHPEHTEVPFSVYGLTLSHKHVPEIQMHSGLATAPLFVPSIGRFSQGMIVQLPLHLAVLPTKPAPADIHAALAKHYEGCRFVTVADLETTDAMAQLEPEALNGTNELRLHVFGNAKTGQAVVMALLDNLGKGASGSTVQNLNLMLGLDEGTGL